MCSRQHVVSSAKIATIVVNIGIRGGDQPVSICMHCVPEAEQEDVRGHVYAKQSG